MACITPPALPDEQLLAYIDGVAAADVVDHLQRCTACRSRAQQLAHQQNQLAAQLYRVDCPSPLELGEYHLDLLPVERIATIERHLSTCLHCAREIQTLQTYLADLAPTLAAVPQPAPTGVAFGSQLKRLVAKLVKTSAGANLSSGASHALAGLRGEQADQFVYEVEGMQIVLELQTEPERPTSKVLLGLVLGLELTQPFEAQLEQTGQIVLTAPVDELGNFIFEHLPPGNYALFLRSPEKEIQVEELRI